MSIKKINIICLFLLFIISTSPGLIHGQETIPGEYEVKAAYIFNFAKFIEWPPESFENTFSPFILGILGNDPFGDDLEKIINQRKISGRNVYIKRMKYYTDNDNAHLLFISSSEKKKIKSILQLLGNQAVLTIGETNEFTRSGGIIQFFLEEGSVQFILNIEAAKNAGLSISSQLLKVAKIFKK